MEDEAEGSVFYWSEARWTIANTLDAAAVMRCI